MTLISSTLDIPLDNMTFNSQPLITRPLPKPYKPTIRRKSKEQCPFCNKKFIVLPQHINKKHLEEL